MLKARRRRIELIDIPLMTSAADTFRDVGNDLAAPTMPAQCAEFN